MSSAAWAHGWGDMAARRDTVIHEWRCEECKRSPGGERAKLHGSINRVMEGSVRNHPNLSLRRRAYRRLRREGEDDVVSTL